MSVVKPFISGPGSGLTVSNQGHGSWSGDKTSVSYLKVMCFLEQLNLIVVFIITKYISAIQSATHLHWPLEQVAFPLSCYTAQRSPMLPLANGPWRSEYRRCNITQMISGSPETTKNMIKHAFNLIFVILEPKLRLHDIAHIQK